MKKTTLVVTLLAVAALAVACGGGGSSEEKPALDITSTAGAITIYGKVVDVSTRAPIAGATAKLIIKDSVLSATTKADDEATADINEAGDFEFQGVAAGTLKLRVEADGFAVYEEWMQISGTGQEAYFYAVGADGKVLLSKGCDIDVYVTAEGSILPNVYVYASGAGSPEIGGVTDTDGHVALTGLSQADNYLVLAVAADTNGDGIYDYANGAASGGSYYRCLDSDKAVAIDMPKAERNDTISLIGGSYERYVTADRYRNQNGTGPDEPIVLVFNYPVSVGSGGITLAYTRDLVPTSDASFGKVMSAPVDTMLSAGNTILTIKSKDPLIQNETYGIDGSIMATVNGDVSYWWPGGDWYVFATGGVSNDTAIRADNYNGKTRVAGTVGAVYLKFPEYVYGRATITAYTQNGTSNTIDPKVVSLGGWSGDILTDEGGALDGCTDGVCSGGTVFYRVSLGSSIPQLSDDASGSVNNVTVYLDVVDYEGNRIEKEYVLSIE